MATGLWARGGNRGSFLMLNGRDVYIGGRRCKTRRSLDLFAERSPRGGSARLPVHTLAARFASAAANFVSKMKSV